MTEQEKLNRINEIFKKMQGNYFLMPKHFSGSFYMQNHDWSYKIYRNTPYKGMIRVHKIFICHKRESICLSFKDSKYLKCQKIEGGEFFPVDHALYYMEEIYKEATSVKNKEKGKESIKNKISSKKEVIKEFQEDISNLYEELEDLEKLEKGDD